MTEHDTMPPGEYLSDRQAIYIPLWVAHYLMAVRKSGLISLTPRLTYGQRLRATKRTMARGYDVPDSKPLTDGMYAHLHPSYTGVRQALAAAARTLSHRNRVAPATHTQLWLAAGQALNQTPADPALRACMLLDALSSEVPPLWRDMRTQLCANLMAEGVQLDAAEAAHFKTVLEWREKRDQALRGTLTPTDNPTKDYCTVEADPRRFL